MLLTLLALVIAALTVLAVIIAAAPAVLLRPAAFACAALCGIVVVLALPVALGASPAAYSLPLGPPGVAMRLALDPLAAAFLMVAFVAAIPCALFTHATRHVPRGSLAALPTSLASLALVFLAGDEATLLLGLSLLGVCAWASQDGGAAKLYLRGGAVAVVCLLAAFSIGFHTSPPWPGGEFATLRTMPPDGWRADLVFVLALVGVGQFLLLLPLDMRLRRAEGDSSGHAAALLAVVFPAVGFYVLVRLLFDLCGPVQPLWWQLPLLVLGALVAVLGALGAAFETEFASIIVGGGLQQTGLALLALGLALGARAADQPALAALALTAFWLQVVSLVLGRSILLLCAAAVHNAAGTRRLDRLGGLIHRMPVIAFASLATLFSVVALPPSLGFAAVWLLFQALLGAARIGGFAQQLLLIAVVAAMALSSSVSVLAAFRLFSVAFLGRPRTPRAAVADEVTPTLRRSLLGGAGLAVLLGVLPGVVLVPAGRALVPLANAGPALPGFDFVLSAGAEFPGYAPIPIAALLAVVGCGVLWLVYRRAATAERTEAAWSEGFAAPPAWLPFGDPVTQYGAGSFAEPLRRSLGLTATRMQQPWGALRSALSGAVGRSRPLAAWLGAVILVLAIWLALT